MCLTLNVCKELVHAEIAAQINRFVSHFPLVIVLLFFKVPCFNPFVCLQFQKRQYAKLEKFPCGKKGYGLKLLQDISKGQFLIEYVGEVSLGLSVFYFLFLFDSNLDSIHKCLFLLASQLMMVYNIYEILSRM